MGKPYLGENLVYKYHTLYTIRVDQALGKEVVTAWYNEIADYQYSSKGIICPKRGSKGPIGHFTQVMWSSTTHLGCGYVTCDKGRSVSIVCQYGPGGNVNIRRTPPFSTAAAKKLDQHPINKKFGGLPICRRGNRLDVNSIIKGLNIPKPSR